jgi:hypothetical protein
MSLTVPPKFSCWNFLLVSQPPTHCPPLVQRLRAKLQVADAHLTIEAIRGFGFRAVPSKVTHGSESRAERRWA